MAVVDVIDLTVSSPPPIIVIDSDVDKPPDSGSYETEDSKEKKNRKKRRKDVRERDRRERRREEKDAPKNDGPWKHDKSLVENWHRQGDKRRRVDDMNVTRSPRRREHSHTPPLFSIDTIAGPSPSIPPQKEPAIDSALMEPAVEPPTEPPVGPTVEIGLLLPPHVTVSSQEPVSLPNEDARVSPNSEASGIDFLDDDRAVGAPRYFHDTVTQAKSARSRGPCTKCGDDDHDFKSCPNMICITCGARNEHGSRSCPILRFCWNCKAKGHLAKDCPRVGNMDLRQLNRQDCERCGSWKHHGTNCPSLWRIYTYLTDAEREAVLVDRESKRQLGFDDGGEGYVARDHWCYNCGGSGHLGDDCGAATPNHDRPNDYSAFGSFNELSGPFASPSSAAPKFERPPREWESGSRFDDGYGFSADNNVGKRGRENAKAKAREAQRLVEEANDEPDWFNMNRAGLTTDKVKAKPLSRGKPALRPKPKPPPPTIHFGVRDSSFSKTPVDPGKRARPPSRPSLRDRISDWRPTEHSQSDWDRGEVRGRDWRREEAELRHRDSDKRDRGYSPLGNLRRERGSRWRGGYDR